MDLSDTDSSTTGEIESPTASDNDSSSSHSPSSVPSLNFDDFELPDTPDFDVTDTSSSVFSETELYPGSTLSTFQAVSVLVSWHSRHP